MIVMPKSRLNKNKEIVFSENANRNFPELLEKYGFDKTSDKLVKKLSAAKTFEQREKILNEFPNRILSKTVREVAEGKISNQSFASELQKRLALSQEKAKTLAEELKQKVLVFANWVSVKDDAPPIKPVSGPKESTPEAEEEPKKPPGKDVYREPVE